MKKKMNILLAALIVLCAAAFLGYRMLDRIRTDIKPPQITMGSDTIHLSVNDPRDLLLSGVSAEDNKDGNVTDSLVIENISLLDRSGRLSVSYAAFDKAGNVAKAQREAVYTDYVGPRFTLNQPLLFRNGVTFDVLNVLGATDLFDGDIQHRIRATSLDENSISAVGTHDVQFQVSNSLGDTVTMVFPVEVYDPKAYDANLALTDYLIYLKVGDSFQASDYLSSFTLLGESTNLTARLPYGYTLNTQGTVDTKAPGVYPVEYCVTYTERNLTNPELDRKYDSYSKLIVVVEG